MRTRIERVLNTIKINGIVDTWTVNFCSSILTQVKGKRTLSPKQKEIFERKEKEYSSKNIKQISEWKDKWEGSPSLREKFLICAKYYGGTRYYTQVCAKAFGVPEQDVMKVHRDNSLSLTEGYMPTYKVFKSMCENKYAEKVLESWYTKPKYPDGTTVAIRVGASHQAFLTARLPAHKDGSTIPYFVMESNARTPWGATRGSKVYKVLPVGSSTPFLVEERALKIYRRKKRA